MSLRVLVASVAAGLGAYGFLGGFDDGRTYVGATDFDALRVRYRVGVQEFSSMNAAVRDAFTEIEALRAEYLAAAGGGGGGKKRLRYFGAYFDNPVIARRNFGEEALLRFATGVVADDAGDDAAAGAALEAELERLGYVEGTLHGGEAIQADFPFRALPLSVGMLRAANHFLMVRKVYPNVLRRHQRRGVPFRSAVELYDSDSVHVISPLHDGTFRGWELPSAAEVQRPSTPEPPPEEREPPPPPPPPPPPGTAPPIPPAAVRNAAATTT